MENGLKKRLLSPRHYGCHFGRKHCFAGRLELADKFVAD